MAKRQIANIGRNDIQRYAAVGAQARLVELRAEIERIHAAFPQLGEDEARFQRQDEARPMRRRGRPARTTVAAGNYGRHVAATPRGGKARRTMSPEARKRIGDAQRARWAKQKAGGKKR